MCLGKIAWFAGYGGSESRCAAFQTQSVRFFALRHLALEHQDRALLDARRDLPEMHEFSCKSVSRAWNQKGPLFCTSFERVATRSPVCMDEGRPKVKDSVTHIKLTYNVRSSAPQPSLTAIALLSTAERTDAMEAGTRPVFSIRSVQAAPHITLIIELFK